jgi:hypothetical protein
MSEAKLQVKIGDVEFSGEGDKAWIETQLNKILKAAPAIVATRPAGQRHVAHVASDDQNQAGAAQPLASFLRDKGAATSQVRKFLATAVWLHAKGKNRLSTADVTRALKDSNQSRLGNPADCLNKNVAKGHCEKDGKDFYVTTEGHASM